MEDEINLSGIQPISEEDSPERKTFDKQKTINKSGIDLDKSRISRKSISKSILSKLKIGDNKTNISSSQISGSMFGERAHDPLAIFRQQRRQFLIIKDQEAEKYIEDKLEDLSESDSVKAAKEAAKPDDEKELDRAIWVRRTEMEELEKKVAREKKKKRDALMKLKMMSTEEKKKA
jgi:hypothetical protein